MRHLENIGNVWTCTRFFLEGEMDDALVSGGFEQVDQKI